VKPLHLGRKTIGAFVAVALLTGCGGAQPPIGAPDAVDQHAKLHARSFAETGGEQTFVVPRGVTQVTVTASGASGGLLGSKRSSGGSYSGTGGPGGRIKATIPVTPGETLYVFVGDSGSCCGGYNGGGASGYGESCSGSCSGGGGKSGTLGNGGYGGGDCFYSAKGGGGGGGTSSSGPYYASAGGGGGSSYAEPQATHVRDKKGKAALGKGSVIISWR